NVEGAGQTIPNLAVAGLGYLGRVSMYSLSDIDLLFDVAGWVTREPAPPSPGVALNPPIPPPPPRTSPIKNRVLLPPSAKLPTPQYLDVINAMTNVPGNDTIDGRPVQIIAKDDQGNATAGAAATRELLDSDNVDVIIGTNFTAGANAELPLTTAA